MKSKIRQYEIEVFGEELAELNALPLEERIKYVDERQKHYDTPKDIIQKTGFPTEYWDSLEEIPKELLEIELKSLAKAK